jgi:hypothetical protein
VGQLFTGPGWFHGRAIRAKPRDRCE